MTPCKLCNNTGLTKVPCFDECEHNCDGIDPITHNHLRPCSCQTPVTTEGEGEPQFHAGIWHKPECLFPTVDQANCNCPKGYAPSKEMTPQEVSDAMDMLCLDPPSHEEREDRRAMLAAAATVFASVPVWANKKRQELDDAETWSVAVAKTLWNKIRKEEGKV